jgi:DNA repair protein RadC
LIQGGPQQELWVVGFDESCRLLGLQRLVPGPQGQAFATVLFVLGWAETTGSRAIVLVQNQPGPRRAATAVELLPTLKLAAAADLVNLIVVNHVVIHSAGAPTFLRQGSVLTEAQTLAAHLQTSLEELSSGHRSFGLPKQPEAPDTLP